jgi:hypothetical protein
MSPSPKIITRGKSTGNFAIFQDTENERPSRPALLSNYCSYPATGICMTAMASSNPVEGKQMQVRSKKKACYTILFTQALMIKTH